MSLPGRHRIGTLLIALGVILLLLSMGVMVRDVSLRQGAGASINRTQEIIWSVTPIPPELSFASATPELSDASQSVKPAFPTLTQSPTVLSPSATHTREISPTPSVTSTAISLPSATFTVIPSPSPARLTATPIVPTPTATATVTATPLPRPIRRVYAPAIGLDAKVVQVGWKLVEENGQMTSVWETASYAAGHHINSAYPGQGGNIVLSGHHNIEGEVFKHLVDLKVGDEVFLETDGGFIFPYEVVETIIVREAGASAEQRRANAQYIAPTADERLTLVTCWPYWTNTHRVIVIARPKRN